MIRVVLRALRLRGFGPFACVTARFEDRISVLVRPNEWGKSTLVEGLKAALFGLGSSGRRPDARRASTAPYRLRSHRPAEAFDALVLLESEGRLFQLHREFESGKVILRSRPAAESLPSDAFEVPRSARVKGGGEWTCHFRGIHRPRAGGPHPFEEWLSRVIGLSSASLFENTFCLTRRLPEADQIDVAVQRLLVGPGSDGLDEALERLLARARRLTSRTHLWGLPAVPGGRRAPADELKVRIEAVSRELEAARRHLDGCAAARRELSRAQAQLEELREVHRRHAESLQAWERYLALLRRRRELVDERARVESALQLVGQLSAEIAALRQKLETDFGDAAKAVPAAQVHLEELAALRERMRGLSERARELESRLQESRSRTRQLGDDLEREFGELFERSDLTELPSRLSQLKACRAELERLENRWLALQDAQLKAREELARMADWSRRGPRPAAEIPELRQQATRMAQTWSRLEALYREREAIANRLATDYRCFEEAAPQAIAAMRRVRERREILTRQLASIDGQIERIGAALERLAADAASLEATFGDVVELESRLCRTGGPDLVDFLDRCETWVIGRRRLAHAADRLAALGARPYRALRRRRLRGAAGRAALGSLAGALAFLYAEGAPHLRLWELPWASRAATAVLGGACLFALAGGRGLARRVRAVSAALAELRGLAAYQAKPGGPPEGTAPVPGLRDLEALAALTERARAYRIQMGRLARREAALKEQGISLQAVDALRARRRRVEASLAELARLTEPFFSRFGQGAPAALGAWEAMRRRLQEVEQAIRRVLEELGVGLAGGEQAVPQWATVARSPLPPAPQRLAEWLLVASPAGGQAACVEQLSTLGGLADLVRGLGERFWESVEDEARRFERATARLHELHLELSELEAPGPDGLSVRERMAQEVERLQALVAPFDGRTDTQWLADRVEACLRLKSRLDAASQETALLCDTLADCRNEAARCRARLDELEQALGPLLRPQGEGSEDEDVRIALERLAQREGLVDRLRRCEDRLAGTLAGYGVQAPEELQARLDRLDVRLSELDQARTELLGQFQGVLPADPDPDVAELEAQYERAREAARLAQEQAAAADERLQRVAGREARVEPVPGLNVAAAEQELRRLRGQLAEVEDELSAVAEAYRTLNEAAAAYHRESRRRLEEVAGAHFSRLSGRPGRRVLIDEAFRVRVAEPDGREYEPRWLSQGARDQLFIALRLAVAAMVDERLRLPFIFDDPFVNCDAARLDHLRESVTQLARDFQVILLTHRPELASWGRKVEVDEA